MSEINYRPNSYKSKEEPKEPEKRVEQVATGKIKKKSGLRKFSDVFVSEDVSNVKNYIVMDVLVPALKKAFSDVITNGIDMLLYGGNGKAKNSNNGGTSYVSYNRFSERKDEPRHVEARRGYNYDDVILDTRRDAEAVLNQMYGLIERYKMVTVFDLYDLVGITGSFTDQKYGWTNVRNAEIVHVREGYMIKMPRPCPLD